MDSVTLEDVPQWVFSIEQADPPDDMIGKPHVVRGPEDRAEPFEPAPVC